MGLFKTPLPIPPGPRANPSPTREADTINRLGETGSILDRLIRLLAPYQPRQITDADGFKYEVLAKDVGRGIVGPRYHVVTLGDVVPEPLSLAASLVDDITPAVLAAVPASAAIASLITGALVDAATSGTSPSSAVSSIEALFNSALTVLDDIPGLVTAKMGAYSPISAILEAKFSGAGSPAPRNGDYICTHATNIVYTLVQEQDGFPSNQSIFSVPFSYGTESWYAISPLPVPDIGGIVLKVTNLVLSLLKQLIAASVDAALQAVGTALVALFDIVDGLVDQLADILGDIADIWGAIAALETALNNLLNDIFGAGGLASDLATLQAAHNALNTAFQTLKTNYEATKAIVDALKEAFDAKITVSAIGEDGNARQIVVFGQEGAAVDKSREITWIDSSAGAGQKGTVIMLSGPVGNTVNVDWREFSFFNQQGVGMKMKSLTLISQGYPKTESESGALTLQDVSGCFDGEEGTKQLLGKE